MNADFATEALKKAHQPLDAVIGDFPASKSRCSGLLNPALLSSLGLRELSMSKGIGTSAPSWALSNSALASSSLKPRSEKILPLPSSILMLSSVVFWSSSCHKSFNLHLKIERSVQF